MDVAFEKQLAVHVEQGNRDDEDRSENAEPAGFHPPILLRELERTAPRVLRVEASRAISGTKKIVAKLRATSAAMPTHLRPLMLLTKPSTSATKVE